MKTIGLIGGMSWESTVTYYQIINQTIKDKLGGLHSAKLLLNSVDFAVIEECQANGEWNKSAEILADAAKNLERIGADFIVICTNTMHKVVPQIQKQISIPIIHIADATADALIDAGIEKVALLGTKYTMTQDFYKKKLIDRGISVVIPDEEDVELVNRVIYDELCLGVISDTSRNQYQRIIEEVKTKGAEGVILGCTEIGLLIHQENSSLPIFDTTHIHARAAALLAILANNPAPLF
jgi:aspartate racemase